MGKTNPSDQEREDQLQVVLSEFVNFPAEVAALEPNPADQSFEQVVDQAFDQADSQTNSKRRIWPHRSNNDAATSPLLGGVPGLRMMGL